MPGTYNFVIVKAFVVLCRLWGRAGAREGRGRVRVAWWVVGRLGKRAWPQAHRSLNQSPPTQVTSKREVRI